MREDRSETPLVAKLGIKPDYEIVVYNEPRAYDQIVKHIPEGVRFASNPTASTSMVHIFATHKNDLVRLLRLCLVRLNPEASIWVSWPKKSSRVPTEVTEDAVREIALPLGLVDIKVCAIDEIWTALKLVTRKTKRRPV